MKNPAPFILTVLVSLSLSLCVAQTQTEVSKPVLELHDNFISIRYDLRNCSEQDTFSVWIEVSNTQGDRILCKSLTGDVGDRISGGNGKKIVWDYLADSVSEADAIVVQVCAEKATSPIQVSDSHPPQRFSTGSILVKSVILPGWGFIQMDRSNLHLIRGIAGYSFITSAIVLNRKAVDNYNRYDGSLDIEERDSFFQTASRQDNLSEALGWAAAGVWSAELIWILIELNSQKKKNPGANNAVSLMPGYDLQTGGPLVAFVYRF